MFLSFLSISPSVDLQIDQMMEQDKRFTRFLPVTLETQFRWEQQTKAIYDKNRKTKHQIKCAHRKCTQIIVILSQLDSFILIAISIFFLCTKFLRPTRSKMHSIRNISDFFYLRNPIWRSIKIASVGGQSGNTPHDGWLLFVFVNCANNEHEPNFYRSVRKLKCITNNACNCTDFAYLDWLSHEKKPKITSVVNPNILQKFLLLK